MKNRNSNQRTANENKNFAEGNAAKKLTEKTVLTIVKDQEEQSSDLKENQNFENQVQKPDFELLKDEELNKEMDEFLNRKTEEKQEQKTEQQQEQKTEIKHDIKRVLTLDEKIQKIKELGILTERRKNLFDSKNKLSEFAIGTTAEGQKLELLDSNKRAFNITNTEAIQGVIDFLKKFLDGKIQDVEKQITFE